MPTSVPEARLVEKLLFSLFFVAVFAVLATSIYRYWYAKDFTILVEAPCDPAFASCYVRDCEVDECPPNGLSEYRIFSVAAKDFTQCADETCLFECSNNIIACEEIACGSTEEDACSE